MTTFALGSSLALGAVPALVMRWMGGRAGTAEAGVMSWVVRLSGGALAAASAWALGHDLLMRFVAYCVS